MNKNIIFSANGAQQNATEKCPFGWFCIGDRWWAVDATHNIRIGIQFAKSSSPIFAVFNKKFACGGTQTGYFTTKRDCHYVSANVSYYKLTPFLCVFCMSASSTISRNLAWCKLYFWVGHWNLRDYFAVCERVWCAIRHTTNYTID